MSTYLSVEDIDRYLSFILTKDENEKSYDSTKIKISIDKNNGDVICNGKRFSGKCFFIALATELCRRYPMIKLELFVWDMMSASGITGSNQKVELIDFNNDNDKIESPHLNQIKRMCETNLFLAGFRIEIYFGTKTDVPDILYTDPNPIFVFNELSTNPNQTIRIVQTLDPAHFDLITNSSSDFFHPILLNMPDAEVKLLRTNIEHEQCVLLNNNQIIKDDVLAQKLELEEHQRRIRIQEADDEQFALKVALEEEQYSVRIRNEYELSHMFALELHLEENIY